MIKFFSFLFVLFIFISCESTKEGLYLEYVDTSHKIKNLKNIKKFYVLNDKIRVDIEMNLIQKLSISLFYSKPTKQLILVSHNLKTIMKNPNVGELFKNISSGEKVSKTGKFEKWKKYDCEIVSTPKKTKLGKSLFNGCVIPFKTANISQELIGILSEMVNLLGSIMGQNLDELDGIVAFTEILDEKGENVLDSKLLKFEKMAISEKLFKVPKDYKVQSAIF